MNKKIFLFLFVLLGFSLFVNSVIAQEKPVEINLFYNDFCPHCIKEGAFLDALEKEYPNLVIKRHSVTSDKGVSSLMTTFYKEYKVPEKNWGLVPILFIKDKYFIDYSKSIKNEIIKYVEDYSGVIKNVYEFNIPFLGTINSSETSLSFLTIILGLLDAFNPCAMWVLLFLIALLINTKSRKRMLLVGETFLFASGLIYYLILNTWLKLFLVVSYINTVRILIGVLALGVGVWQIKDFINYKPGVCKVSGGESNLQKKIKNNIENKTKEITETSISVALLIGVALLAFGVNMVEFFYSTGTPAIFAQILSLNATSDFQYQFYVLLYTFIFILDDILIFLVVFFTLKQFNFTQEYNYWSTLIGSLLIFVLGLFLIFKPEMLLST